MPTRKPRDIRNPELARAVDSLNDAAQHVRNAVHGKIDEVKGAAAAELARAKALALQKTGITHEKVDAVLKKAEGRLHKVIVKAQKALDKAVRKAEKRAAAAAESPPPAPAPEPAPAPAQPVQPDVAADSQPAAAARKVAKRSGTVKAGTKPAVAKKAAARKTTPTQRPLRRSAKGVD